MEHAKNDEIKIAIKKDRIITRKQLFERKEKFHKEQATVPFEEKIKILVKLQEIAICIKGDSEKTMIWKI
jgi:hypothetical protein